MNYQPEATQQAKLVSWMEDRGLTFTAIPHETPAQDIAGYNDKGRPIWKQRFKTTTDTKTKGVRPGFPDIAVIVPCADKKKHLIFIEMKAPQHKGKTDPIADWKPGQKSKGGVAQIQREWILKLRECEGVDAFVCHTAKGAQRLIETLMTEPEIFL